MNLDDIVVRLAEAFDQAGIRYMFVGSFSSNFYGAPRSTQDLDVVIDGTTGKLKNFERSLGRDFHLDPQRGFELTTATSRLLMRVGNNGFSVEIFLLSQDAHDQLRFQRRRSVTVYGATVWLPTAEDVIITKLRWLRPKDETDISGIIAAQNAQLDWTYLEHWCDQHGTLAALERLRQSV